MHTRSPPITHQQHASTRGCSFATLRVSNQSVLFRLASHKTEDGFPVKTSMIVEKDARVPGTKVVQNPPNRWLGCTF